MRRSDVYAQHTAHVMRGRGGVDSEYGVTRGSERVRAREAWQRVMLLFAVTAARMMHARGYALCASAAVVVCPARVYVAVVMLIVTRDALPC